MLSAVPTESPVTWLGDKAYDADHWRGYLKSRRIQPVIPNRSNRKKPHPFNKARYKGRNVIERMFGRIKDFRRVATRYDKNAENFLDRLMLGSPHLLLDLNESGP